MNMTGWLTIFRLQSAVKFAFAELRHVGAFVFRSSSENDGDEYNREYILSARVYEGSQNSSFRWQSPLIVKRVARRWLNANLYQADLD